MLELIFAISIFSIVIFVGYNLLNHIYKTQSYQKNTTNNQISINSINTYLTKDIEKSTNISKVDNGNSYEYVIQIGNESAIYRVEKYNNRNYFKITRTFQDKAIVILDNIERNQQEPLIISGKGIYEVSVNYKENGKDKNINFKVSSRIQ